MNLRIALAGNPNCGKTTLFNALTGSNQFVGNWPGVTVEKKEGKLRGYDNITVTDLPGIYSLSPYTMEEVVARDYLIEQRPDVILNIVDGTNLERNLYLTTQHMEIGIPVILAVNMMDVVRKNGDSINIPLLSKELGITVVEISALKAFGINEAVEAAIYAAKQEEAPSGLIFSRTVEKAIAHIEETALQAIPKAQRRWYAVKFFEGDPKIEFKESLSDNVAACIQKERNLAEKQLDDDAESIITNERYAYISRLVTTCSKKNEDRKYTASDKIDRVVTDRLLGIPVFAVIMFLVYWVSMGPFGSMMTDWANEGVFGDGWNLFNIWIPGIPTLVSQGLESIGTAAWLCALINDGIVAGVGAVLGFVPQMLILFFMLSFLESCGYMSRIAFVLDRVFRRFGLSGKSFIPMLVGTGCGVPGVMASRTIESDRDRRMTVMTTTFIPCGAKVPFIAMIAGALFGGSALVSTSAYFIGMAAIVISGIILKKTKMFSGDVAPFVMELPAYHLPMARNLLKSTWERGWSFIKKAGTIIMLSTITVWATTYFGIVDGNLQMLTEEQLSSSFLAYIGGGISFIFSPLGWGTWEATVASITGLVAKENIVGTMGILYGTTGNLYETLQNTFTGISGFSFLVFNLLCAPCFAAIGAIKREMSSPKWTWFAISYQCGFAYAVSLMINQFGNAFSGKMDVIGFIAAFITLLLFIYMLVRPSDLDTKSGRSICYECN